MKKLTRCFARLARELDVDEIDLELLVRLDTDKKRGSTAGSDYLVRIMGRFEDEGKRSLELLEHGLDQLGECRLLLVLIKDVLGEDGDSLSVRLGFEPVTPLLEHEAKIAAVGNDTVVNDDEFGGRV